MYNSQFEKIGKNHVNQYLKELYLQLKQAYDLLDEYIKGCADSETDLHRRSDIEEVRQNLHFRGLSVLLCLILIIR